MDITCGDEAALSIASLDGNTPVTSPISKLNNDLILLIFRTNVGVEPTRPRYVYRNRMKTPLTTARFTSQVCRSWRHLLLDSPSIWGKLLDLDSLDQKSAHWREEVLRRTQSAPLWIRGNIDGSCEHPTPVRLYFFSLLYDKRRWQRIERLDIIVYGTEISDEAWNTFFLPAPNLRVFDVGFPHTNNLLFKDALSSNPPKRLFGDHAPALTRFSADNIVFAVDSLWLSNLREISVCGQFTIPQIVQLLSHTPLLETFWINLSDTELEWVPIGTVGRVELPALDQIFVANTLGACCNLLEAIYPARTCSLSFVTNYFDDNVNITQDTVRSLRQNLPRYIYNYFDTRNPKGVKLHLLNGLFSFEDEPDRRTDPITRFNLSIGTGSDTSQSQALTDVLLKVFIKCASDTPSLFTCATKLSFDIRHAQTLSLKYFCSMLSSFPSIRHLRTNEDNITLLLSMISLKQADDYAADRALSTLFPSLQVLQLTYLIPDPHSPTNSTHDSLLPFLKQRKESGYPINTLDLTLCRSDTLRDFDFLEEIEGLEVLVLERKVQVSYLCGSGVPDKLRFRAKSGLSYFNRQLVDSDSD